MNLRQIEVFRAVMQAGTVSGGAARLNVSAPAVSRLLSHLESRLGVRLFDRRAGRLQPTPEARALMQEIDAAFHHIDRVRHTAAGLKRGAGQRLRLCTNLSTALELVPRAAARLCRDWPQLQLSIEVAALPQMRDGLERGDHDLGVGAFLEVDAGALQRHPVGRGELQLLMPADHALARLARVDLAALRDQALIAYGLGGSHGRQLAERLGLAPGHSGIDVPYAYMAAALVACGQGIAVVDDLTLRHFHATPLARRPLEPALGYAVEALSDAQRPLGSAAAALLQALRIEWQALQR